MIYIGNDTFLPASHADDAERDRLRKMIARRTGMKTRPR